MLGKALAGWRRHPILATTTVLAATLTVFFAVRALLFAFYWADPAHRDQPLEGWMTPGYVAHSWHLEREAFLHILGPAAQPGLRLTLAQIAEQNGESLADLLARVEAAVIASRRDSRK